MTATVISIIIFRSHSLTLPLFVRMTSMPDPNWTQPANQTSAKPKKSKTPRQRSRGSGQKSSVQTPCHRCKKLDIVCSLEKPDCAQCIASVGKCSGYPLKIRWAGGAASRGHLAKGCFPDKNAPAFQPPSSTTCGVNSPSERTATANVTEDWATPGFNSMSSWARVSQELDHPSKRSNGPNRQTDLLNEPSFCLSPGSISTHDDPIGNWATKIQNCSDIFPRGHIPENTQLGNQGGYLEYSSGFSMPGELGVAALSEPEVAITLVESDPLMAPGMMQPAGLDDGTASHFSSQTSFQHSPLSLVGPGPNFYFEAQHPLQYSITPPVSLGVDLMTRQEPCLADYFSGPGGYPMDSPTPPLDPAPMVSNTIMSSATVPTISGTTPWEGVFDFGISSLDAAIGSLSITDTKDFGYAPEVNPPPPNTSGPPCTQAYLMGW